MAAPSDYDVTSKSRRVLDKPTVRWIFSLGSIFLAFTSWYFEHPKLVRRELWPIAC